MSFNARFLTIKSLRQVLLNAVLSEEQANPQKGIFFIGDISEELLWFRSLVKAYNSEVTNESKVTRGPKVPGAPKVQTIRSIFDPVKNYFSVVPSHLAFANGFGYNVTQFDTGFRYVSKIVVKYKGIFKFGTKLKERPFNFEMMDDSWCFPLWKRFYEKRPTAADVSIRLINHYFMVFTEMQRSLIIADRSDARKKKKNINENAYWRVVDALRNVFANERSLDLTNPRVFAAVTDLVNGTPSFYFQSCDYPCIHLLNPSLFNDQTKAFVWCFNNIRMENFSLISGFLKNYSRKDSSIPIGLFEHDSEVGSKQPHRKTTPHSLFRSFLGYIKDAWASGNSDINLQKRLRVLEDLVLVVKSHFLDFPEDQEPTMDGNDVATVFGFVNVETRFETILAIEILAVISKADSTLSIKSPDDATRINDLLRFAIAVFKNNECKTWKYLDKRFSAGDFEHIALQELMIYIGLTRHNWFEFKDYTGVFKRFGNYVPTFIHEAYLEDYDYEMEFKQYKFKDDLVMGC